MDLFTQSVNETEQIGHRIGGLLQSGDIVCLSGELGAGKTTLTRGIVAGLGSLEPVTSPTYALVNEYKTPSHSFPIFHLDAYRLADAQEAETLAFDDILDADGVVIVEWPERILTQLPADRLWIELKPTDDDQTRHIRLQAQGAESARRLAQIRQHHG